MKWVLSGCIRFYQKAISPLLAPRCRFYPSCSAYAQDALLQHATFKALSLIVKRLLKCHPFHPGGVDFVPSKIHKTDHERDKKTT